MDRVRGLEIIWSFHLPSLSEQMVSHSLRWYDHLHFLPLQAQSILIFDLEPISNSWKCPEEKLWIRWVDIIRGRVTCQNADPNDPYPPKTTLEETNGADVWLTWRWRHCRTRVLNQLSQGNVRSVNLVWLEDWEFQRTVVGRLALSLEN